MKVVHIESGLGNQMLSYCEYLVLKKLHPNEDIYIETIIYDIPEANEVIKQWNGYELERIFGIKAPNIKSVFTEEQWNEIMKEVRDSEFWLKNWNYPVYITWAFRNAGLEIKNIRGDFELPSATKNLGKDETIKPSLKKRLIDTSLGNFLRRWYRYFAQNKLIKASTMRDKVFYQGNDNIFTGQWLSLKMRDSGLDFIDKELHEAFRFPDWNSEQNSKMAQFLESVNSVAIHARRGDMLGVNGFLYKYGYFQRAVKYIRKHVDNPVFVFFTNPGSVEWCKENEKIFGLNFKKDKVYFVDWNKSEDSFRDMQLISHCKHAIVTNSSFGWWGSYFISNPNKITISPMEDITINTTNHC